MKYKSWGNYPNRSQKGFSFDEQRIKEDYSYLPFGRGRSYGDSCLNSEGIVLDSNKFNSVIRFNDKDGEIEVGSGMTFGEVLDYIVPHSFFLPITPGTQFATIGGGLANDVHGKNHHIQGSLGNHAISFKILREGKILECSRDRNSNLFRATIGGLGLTGFILSVTLKLKKIKCSYVKAEHIKFNTLEEFMELSEESKLSHEYIVSWIDCTSSKNSVCKGIFSRGNHLEDNELGLKQKNRFNLKYPFRHNASLVNKFTVKPFNYLYYNKQMKKKIHNVSHYNSFFYPLDFILDWNYIYGSKGFIQHQSLLPKNNAIKFLSKMLNTINKSNQGSFLVVLKTMGGIKPEGILSFASEGVTLAIDFANQGDKTLKLIRELNDIVSEANGKIYPAKDACMTPEDFRSSFPNWKDLENFRDKNISSDFWRRVTK